MSSPLLFPALLFSVVFKGGCLYSSCCFTQEGVCSHGQWRDVVFLKIAFTKAKFLACSSIFFSILYSLWSRKVGFSE